MVNLLTSMKNTTISATIEIEVPFFDLDPMMIVWHGNYVKYFEQARCALLRSFDYDYPQMEALGYSWPIVDLRVRYAKSAVFGEILKCTATLKEFENRIKISYEIYNKSGARLTKGHTVQVAVDKTSGLLQLASPQHLIDKIKARNSYV